MRTGKEFCGTQLIEVLNEDIECELRIADRHIARALLAARLGKYAVRRYSSVCAAAAMRRATALAAEVLHLGGVPPRHVPAEESCSKDRLARASSLFRRYRRRLGMAHDLGLLRLEEVLREVIQDLGVCSRVRGGMFRPIRIG